jgi:hypothetical protein
MAATRSVLTADRVEPAVLCRWASATAASREVYAMPVRTPSLEQLSEIALEYGLDLSEDDLASFQGLVAGVLASYGRLDELPEPLPPVRYPRSRSPASR